MALAELTDADRVGVMLAQSVADLGEVDAASLDQACTDASAIVLDHLMRPDVTGLAEEVQAAVAFVATKVAARIFRNPGEVGSFSFDATSQTYVDPRILTSDEKALLRRARSAKVIRGPVFSSMTVAEEET